MNGATAVADASRAFVPFHLVRIAPGERLRIVRGSATYRDVASELRAVGPGDEIGPEAHRVVAGDDGLEAIVIVR